MPDESASTTNQQHKFSRNEVRLQLARQLVFQVEQCIYGPQHSKQRT